MLADELMIIDGDSPLWEAARPLLNAALRLERNEDTYTWHGWDKQQIAAFLQGLPSSCSLVAGVWQIIPGEEGRPEREDLVLGLVCEVAEGSIRTIRTFEALAAAGLRALDQLEAGIDDALEIIRAASALVAPVAWALFIEKEAWDEWVCAAGENGAVIDKGEALAALARQGRCVILGNQAAPAHHQGLA